MTKVGALWLKTSKQGKKYMTGVLDQDAIPTIEKVPVVVFRNMRKKDDKHPDYLIYLSEPKEDGGGSSGPMDDEDVPF